MRKKFIFNSVKAGIVKNKDNIFILFNLYVTYIFYNFNIFFDRQSGGDKRNCDIPRNN